MIVPSTGLLALDMMCGDWGASRCSPRKWFTYMGDAEGNPYVPFQITYMVQPNTDPIDGYIPQNPKVVPCYQAVNVSHQIFLSFHFNCVHSVRLFCFNL